MTKIIELAIEKFPMKLHENQATNTPTSSSQKYTEINSHE